MSIVIENEYTSTKFFFKEIMGFYCMMQGIFFLVFTTYYDNNPLITSKIQASTSKFTKS